MPNDDIKKFYESGSADEYIKRALNKKYEAGFLDAIIEKIP